MKFTSTFALGAVLTLGAMVVAAPVVAQQAEQEAKAPQRKYSRQAQKPLAALQAASQAEDPAAFQAALAEAQAAAQNSDDRYVIAQFMLNDATKAQDSARQMTALEAMIQSGGATDADLPRLHKALGQLAFNAKDMTKAETNLARVVQLTPNDYEVSLLLSQIQADQKRPAEAIATLERVTEAAAAAGSPVPESWYKLRLKYAYEANLGPQSIAAGRALISAHPNATNWRDSLSVYREVSQLDRPATIDLLRLMRAAKALNGERDYYELADALNNAGLPGETKAVLEEGIASKALDGNKTIFKEMLTVANGRVAEDRASLAGLETKANAAANGTLALGTGDAYFGYGDYAKAAALYRTALQKGSVDANVANTRLGMALALAGQRAEAEAALKAVSGPRAEIANYWMLWLDKRA